jgi:hypothetical protein
MKPKKRPQSPFKDERSADVTLWIADGAAVDADARVAADIEVSIGRTNSRRGVGFIVGSAGDCHSLNPARRDNGQTSFVLDRDQVAELIRYLRVQLGRLKRPLGRKTDSIMFTRMTSPRVRLDMELLEAARKLHPGWHFEGDDNDENWSWEDDAPDGAKLLKWFERTHPRKAQRIKRNFTKRLWEGQL